METETHMFALRVPKGTSQRATLELVRAALAAQGHDVQVSGWEAAPGGGGVLALSLSGEDKHNRRATSGRLENTMHRLTITADFEERDEAERVKQKITAALSTAGVKGLKSEITAIGTSLSASVLSLSADAQEEFNNKLALDPRFAADPAAQAGFLDAKKWSENQLRARGLQPLGAK